MHHSIIPSAQVQYSASTVQCSTLQYSASTVQYSASAVQYSTVQYSTVQYSRPDLQVVVVVQAPHGVGPHGDGLDGRRLHLRPVVPHTGLPHRPAAVPQRVVLDT